MHQWLRMMFGFYAISAENKPRKKAKILIEVYLQILVVDGSWLNDCLVFFIPDQAAIFKIVLQ